MRVLMLALLAVACLAEQIPLQQNQIITQNYVMNSIKFEPEWHILGPWQIGTREATWGSDPLEQFGGFRSLQYDTDATFRSSLTPNGSVHWSRLQVRSTSTENGGCKLDLNVAFPKVDWKFLQSVYGWAALQWQGWARGTVFVDGDYAQTVTFYTDGVLEFWLDGETYFGGDYYSFRKAPVVLHLEPGQHQLDVRLVRDGRVMGSVGEPDILLGLEFMLGTEPIEVEAQRLLISDVVAGVLASPHASVPVRNTGVGDIKIVQIVSTSPGIILKLDSEVGITLKAGQTRPIMFSVSGANSSVSELAVEISYLTGSVTKIHRFTHALVHKSLEEVHKFTFLHPSGIVSYAMVRAPPVQDSSDSPRRMPILLNLHGAGLEADDPQLTSSLDAVTDLPVWVIFPTGGTPWSGDDWHQWGWSDVEAAINALPNWRDGKAAGAMDITRWLVAGHSNGAQGVWHALTHHPDKVIAAVPVSGYLSIQKYVPYTLWHEADPARTSVVQASLSTHRHELLISNAKDIPIMQQHGDADDNVPIFHSRRMSQLINEPGWWSEYAEVAGAGHWFEGIMTTTPLERFYRRILLDGVHDNREVLSFTVVSANPADTTSKRGFHITQLADPGRIGKLNVQLEPELIRIVTSNIESFTIKQANSKDFHLSVDGQDVASSVGRFSKAPHGVWRADDITSRQSLARTLRQQGRLEAILASRGTLRLRSNGDAAARIALQVSRNLYQYFGADSEILDDGADAGPGNLITILQGEDVPAGQLSPHPIEILNKTVAVRDDAGVVRRYAGDGISVIFLRPLPDERLELVIWGDDEASLTTAARLMPMLTGVGQPEFIILSRECAWKGLEGVLAMGFLDSQWNATRSSFFS